MKQGNRLLERVRRHANLSVLFRRVEPTSAPPSGLAMPGSAAPLARATTLPAYVNGRPSAQLPFGTTVPVTSLAAPGPAAATPAGQPTPLQRAIEYAESAGDRAAAPLPAAAPTTSPIWRAESPLVRDPQQLPGITPAPAAGSFSPSQWSTAAAPVSPQATLPSPGLTAPQADPITRTTPGTPPAAVSQPQGPAVSPGPPVQRTAETPAAPAPTSPGQLPAAEPRGPQPRDPAVLPSPLIQRDVESATAAAGDPPPLAGTPSQAVTEPPTSSQLPASPQPRDPAQPPVMQRAPESTQASAPPALPADPTQLVTPGGPDETIENPQVWSRLQSIMRAHESKPEGAAPAEPPKPVWYKESERRQERSIRRKRTDKPAEIQRDIERPVQPRGKRRSEFTYLTDKEAAKPPQVSDLLPSVQRSSDEPAETTTETPAAPAETAASIQTTPADAPTAHSVASDAPAEESGPAQVEPERGQAAAPEKVGPEQSQQPVSATPTVQRQSDAVDEPAASTDVESSEVLDAGPVESLAEIEPAGEPAPTALQRQIDERPSAEAPTTPPEREPAGPPPTPAAPAPTISAPVGPTAPSQPVASQPETPTTSASMGPAALPFDSPEPSLPPPTVASPAVQRQAEAADVPLVPTRAEATTESESAPAAPETSVDQPTVQRGPDAPVRASLPAPTATPPEQPTKPPAETAPPVEPLTRPSQPAATMALPGAGAAGSASQPAPTNVPASEPFAAEPGPEPVVTDVGQTTADVIRRRPDADETTATQAGEVRPVTGPEPAVTGPSASVQAKAEATSRPEPPARQPTADLSDLETIVQRTAAAPPSSPITPTSPAPAAPDMRPSLETVWPVEHVDRGASADDDYIPPPPQPPALRLDEEKEVISRALAKVEPGEGTRAKVDLQLPRRARPRPVPPPATPSPGPENNAATLAPTSEVQAPVISPDAPATLQRAIESAATPAPAADQLVETEVGQLPADLWGYLGETAPADGKAAQTTSVDLMRFFDGGDVAYGDVVPPRVQRRATIQDVDSQVRQPEAAPEADSPEDGGAGEPDLDALAEQVYAEIKRRIRLEWERSRGRFR